MKVLVNQNFVPFTNSLLSICDTTTHLFSIEIIDRFQSRLNIKLSNSSMSWREEFMEFESEEDYFIWLMRFS